MQEMATNIRQNMDNAKETETFALKAAGDAAAGREVMEKTLKFVRQIAVKITIVEEIAHWVRDHQVALAPILS